MQCSVNYDSYCLITIHAAYVDLCKAFDLVSEDALWRIICLRGVTPKLNNLMSELYSGTKRAVKCGDTINDIFPVVTGVRQGCVLPPTIFSACMNWILGRMSERSSCDASFGNVKIPDLDFADDAVIFAEIGRASHIFSTDIYLASDTRPL